MKRVDYAFLHINALSHLIEILALVAFFFFFFLIVFY